MDLDDELEAMTQKIKDDFLAANHKKVTPEQFREMSKFCETMVQDLMTVFIAFQEKFKQGALAFARLAEFLEKDAKVAERDTKVDNVFEKDGPTDPGPIVTND